jgi:hypothetical protein
LTSAGARHDQRGRRQALRAGCAGGNASTQPPKTLTADTQNPLPTTPPGPQTPPQDATVERGVAYVALGIVVGNFTHFTIGLSLLRQPEAAGAAADDKQPCAKSSAGSAEATAAAAGGVELAARGGAWGAGAPPDPQPEDERRALLGGARRGADSASSLPGGSFSGDGAVTVEVAAAAPCPAPAKQQQGGRPNTGWPPAGGPSSGGGRAAAARRAAHACIGTAAGLVSPPLVASLSALAVGMCPPVRDLLFGPAAPLGLLRVSAVPSVWACRQLGCRGLVTC